MPRFDVAIIGTGPAGLEAALNLQIRNKNFVLFGPEHLSTKIARAPKIDNYLGLPEISGEQLQQAFRSHLEQMQIQPRHEQVSTVYPMGNYFALATNHNTFEASAVILATGVSNTSAFPGEEELLGRGVGYCATCDAPLFKGKRVAILGYSDDAVYEANFVGELAQTVYYIPLKPRTAPLKNGVEELVVKPKGIIREDGVLRLLLAEGEPLEIDGIFILRESIAPSALLPGLATQDGFVVVDQNMKTNLPGCFAAGDCTGRPHQYIRAAGQGLIAAHSAVAYLDHMETN